MEFIDAQQVLLPHGKYKDQTIDMIAQTDEGLLYLDWLVGTNYWWLFRDFQGGPDNNVKEALQAYLGDSDITAEVERAIETSGRTKS